MKNQVIKTFEASNFLVLMSRIDTYLSAMTKELKIVSLSHACEVERLNFVNGESETTYTAILVYEFI